jgi:hypothetical protein
MVRQLMPTFHGPLKGGRVKLAYASGSEDGALYIVGIEQLQQAPDSHPSAELALCAL